MIGSAWTSSVQRPSWWVVWGHWTMAAVTVADGELVAGRILVLAEWTHPLTWVLQVMPVFFLVGGYANGLSWRSARARGATYGGWLRARTRRLTLPVVPVLVAWFALGWVALRLGMDPGTLRLASTVGLVPTWFLASYILVVALAPLGLLAWERWGWWSVAPESCSPASSTSSPCAGRASRSAWPASWCWSRWAPTRCRW